MGWVIGREVGEWMGWKLAGRWMPFVGKFGLASPTTVAGNTLIAAQGSVAMPEYFGQGRK